jgi:hypothetical protein
MITSIWALLLVYRPIIVYISSHRHRIDTTVSLISAVVVAAQS